MINEDGGWTIFRFYKGDIELMSSPPPPLAKTLKDVKTKTKIHYS